MRLRQKLLARVAVPGLIIPLLLAGLVLPVRAWAQAKSPQKGATLYMGPQKIEGRIQKPQAFYVLQRSNLNFEGLELKQSFVPKIIDSVEKDPF